mmetsp:Transcript_8361/g.12546  ORF Transcript_8361/g.12546 Transcript_8361/m.12546 type:complete len:2207 (+) Transcript_8361:120-6740(+)
MWKLGVLAVVALATASGGRVADDDFRENSSGHEIDESFIQSRRFSHFRRLLLEDVDVTSVGSARRGRRRRRTNPEPNDDVDELLDDLGNSDIGKSEQTVTVESPQEPSPVQVETEDLGSAKPKHSGISEVFESSAEGSEPTTEEIRKHEEAADEQVQWAVDSPSESCELILDGDCVSPMECEDHLCNGHGYCVKYDKGPACNCDPGFASARGKFCNVCESDRASYPRCAHESAGDRQAESIAMERVCGVFELPSTLNLPGLAATRSTVAFSDWFKSKDDTYTRFTIARESLFRAHIIPGDPRDNITAHLIDDTKNYDMLVTKSIRIDGATHLAHESVLHVILSPGKYRLLLHMPENSDSKGVDCKRYHLQVEFTPKTRILSPKEPYKCPERTTVPKFNTKGFQEDPEGRPIIPHTGLEFSSIGGTLAVAGTIHQDDTSRKVFHFDFVTKNLVDMIPFIDATLSSNFLPGHMRIVLRRLDSAVHAESTQAFVANTDSNPNHIGLALDPNKAYRLEIWEILSRLPDAGCAFYDLTVSINYADIRGHVETAEGFVDERCSLVSLPRTFDIPGYLGYAPEAGENAVEGSRRMHVHETFRYNPNVHQHHISFHISEPSIFRIYVPFHQTQLTIKSEIVRHSESGIGSTMLDGKSIKSSQNDVNDDLTAELLPGVYSLVLTFSFSDTLIQTPGSMRCVGFVGEIAIMPTMLLGGGHHWCGPNAEATETLPEISDGGTHPGRTQAYVMLKSTVGEKQLAFSVETEKKLLELSIDSDFVTGHVTALIKRKKGAVTTTLVIPAIQVATNHMILKRELSKGDYVLVIRPLFVYAKRECIPYDFHMFLSDVNSEEITKHEIEQVATSKTSGDISECSGDFEPFPKTLNSLRYLGGSGQTESTHFAGNFFVASSESHHEHNGVKGFASVFTVHDESLVRVSIDTSATSSTFRLLRFSCVEHVPYPYVGIDYIPVDPNCEPEILWEESTAEFSRVVEVNTGYYELLVIPGEHCVKFHMEFAISPKAIGSRGHHAEGKCPNSADHLPPHPPEQLTRHHIYNSQNHHDHLHYQSRPGRRLSFMAPMHSERPFRLLIEVGYDFLLGDLRIDLVRHRERWTTQKEPPIIEKIFSGKPLSGRRRRLAASALPPGQYSLWLHEPVTQDTKDNKDGTWECVGFTWRVETHVLQPQRFQTLSPEMLHPELQERIPAHPALPLSLNVAGCLVPTGECELHGVFTAMHQVWNTNLPSQNWEENSVAFNLATKSLVRIYATPLVLGAIESMAFLRLRLVHLGRGAGSGEELDLQAPRGDSERPGGWGKRGYSRDDTTTDDWVVKELPAGSYAIIVNVQYPGTVDAWHAWRMHFTVFLHVAVATVPEIPGGLWELPETPGDTDTPADCGGEACGGVIMIRNEDINGPGAVYKVDKTGIKPCTAAKERDSPDPSCDHGIKSQDGRTCCHKSCGRCGGDGCHLLPLGAKACCATSIKEHSGACSEHSAPCNLFGDGSRLVKTIMFEVTQDEGVYLIAETSFGFLHQHLGLILEGFTSGHSPTGREIKRDVRFKGIPQHTSSYLDLDLGKGTYNISVVELGPAPVGHKGSCENRHYSLLVYISSKIKATKNKATGSYQRNEHDKEIEEWVNTLQKAADDRCASHVSLPMSFLPLPDEIHAFKKTFDKKNIDLNLESSLQTWGGDDWSRLYAKGFNHIVTEANPVSLKRLGINGEGGAFAMRMRSPKKGSLFVRITAVTNSRKEQLLYAIVNSTGSFVTPTSHSPTSVVNPAFFLLEGSSVGSHGSPEASGDPMDALITGTGVTPDSLKHDYYLLLQPRRITRESKEWTEGEEECPEFSLNLAAAPAHEIAEYLIEGPGDGSWKCEEILPAPFTIPENGIFSETTSLRYTSDTSAIHLSFEVKVKSQVNLYVYHNYLLGDFVLSLAYVMPDGEMRPITSSETNILEFGKKAELQIANSARHDSHQMLAETDVGAAIHELDVEKGKYEIQISENSLSRFPKTFTNEHKLCVDALLAVDIKPKAPLAQRSVETSKHDYLEQNSLEVAGKEDTVEVETKEDEEEHRLMCQQDSCGCTYDNGICTPIGRCSVHQYGEMGRIRDKILCTCPKNFDGSRCQRCQSGYNRYPECVPEFEKESSSNIAINNSGRDTVIEHLKAPKEVEDSRPHLGILLAYTLAIVACMFVLIAIMLKLQNRNRYFVVRSRDGDGIYSYRDDGL